MQFQWDSLLLEAGLLATLYAPPVLRLARAAEPPRATRLLLAFLLFRLMFLSGVVKLTWGDTTWRDLTALEYHFFTQPIPSLTSWWAHQTGPAAHTAMCAIMFGIELATPFLFFAPRRLRLVAAASQIALQLAILSTGNYGFFNWLTIVLCLPLLDDAALARLTPPFLRRPPVEPTHSGNRLARHALTLICLALFVLEAHQFALGLAPRPREELVIRDGLAGLWDRSIEKVDAVLGEIAPLRAVNPYGLFRSMTTTRPEITVEGSNDGVIWRPYRFKWKPGPLDRAPGFVAPHMPRLDWQMWFAALSQNCQNARWYLLFARRLLQNAPEVTALLDENPFPQAPPRLLRSTLSDYRFTTRAERETSGAFWLRENDRPFCPTLKLDGDQLRVDEARP